jgi:hypothetical protein
VAGYNISFGEKGARTPTINDGAVDINAVGGDGDGYPPASSRTIDYVARIAGASPDGRGNLQVEGLDCLRVFQPRIENDPIPATIQINSDCLPCCPCSSYRNFSRAVGRRSAKIKDLCDDLNQILNTSATAYNDAVATINAGRKPMAVVRNVRTLGSRLQFSVQNMSSVKIFAYVQLRILNKAYEVGVPEVSGSHMNGIDLAPYSGDPAAAVDDHRTTLEALPFNIAERPEAGIPSTNFDSTPEPLILACVGQLSSSGTMIPIEPGAVIQCVLSFPDCSDAMEESGSEDGSLVKAYPEFQFQTIAVYGASHCYACSAETYQAKVVDKTDELDELESCSMPLADSFDTVQVPT